MLVVPLVAVGNNCGPLAQLEVDAQKTHLTNRQIVSFKLHKEICSVSILKRPCCHPLRHSHSQEVTGSNTSP